MPANVHDPTPRPGSAFRPWMGLPIALLAGAIAWGLIERLHPVFHVSSEYDVPDLGAPAEDFAAHRAARNRADRYNAMLDLAIVGGLVAGALALTGTARRPVTRAVVAVPLGGLGGAAGGVLGSLVHAAWVQTAGQPDVIHAVGLHSAALAPLGLGVGLAAGAAGAAGGRFRTAVPAGLVGGALAGVLYPVAMSLLLPAAETEALIPAESGSRLLYVGMTAALLGLLMPAAASLRKDAPPVDTQPTAPGA